MRRIAIVIVSAALLGLLGLFLLDSRRVIAPIEPPTSARFPHDLIAKGEVLVADGRCASFHTRPGDSPVSMIF